jgi:hypothetical protein
MSNVVDFHKWDPGYMHFFVDRLVREYIAIEIANELAKDSTMAVRVLGEVLAGKPGFSEAVSVVAAQVMRELLEPNKGKK